MKNLLTFIVCICFFITGFSQITEAEYFIDTDPGIGSAIALTVTSGATIDENFSMPTTGLTEGLHVLHIRAKGTNNIWSLYKRTYFYVQMPSTNGTSQNIVAAAYFVDTDPGIGNGLPLTITPNLTINETFTIPTAGLAEGLHVLHIRVKDASDTWSLYKRTYFYIHAANSNVTATPIVAAEYFFDTDPGIGSAISVAVTQGFNIDEDLVIQVPFAMTDGEHYLYIRVQNQDNIWSLYKRALFTVDASLTVEEFNSDSFKIFPNPTENNVHINFKQSGTYSFSVYTISGKEIFQQEKLELNNSFNFSKYASGVYILKIKDKRNNTFQNVKIVKQ
jgi:hypothetical protein